MASRKRINLANASLRCIKSFFLRSNKKVDGDEAVQNNGMKADLGDEVENEMKKITYCLLYYRRFPLLCIKRDTPCQLQINWHFHFLNFPTASSLLHIREVLVHWPFLEISGPQKRVVGATLAIKHNFLAGTLLYCSTIWHLAETKFYRLRILKCGLPEHFAIRK